MKRTTLSRLSPCAGSWRRWNKFFAVFVQIWFFFNGNLCATMLEKRRGLVSSTTRLHCLYAIFHSPTRIYRCPINRQGNYVLPALYDLKTMLVQKAWATVWRWRSPYEHKLNPRHTRDHGALLKLLSPLWWLVKCNEAPPEKRLNKPENTQTWSYDAKYLL